jgi:predicted Zn-dependent protease
LAVYALNFLDESSPKFQPMLAEAKVLALRAKTLDDQLPRIYIALAMHARMISKDRAEYKRNLEMTVKLIPKSPVAYNNLASWYLYGAQPQQAIELLNKALSLDPKGVDVIFLNMARSYLMLGDNAAAVEWANRGVELGGSVPQLFSTLARAHANLGQMDKATQYASEYKQRIEKTGRKAGIAKLEDAVSPAFVKYYNEHFVPEWRKAGLPE